MNEKLEFEVLKSNFWENTFYLPWKWIKSIFVLKRCLELGVLLWYQLESYTTCTSWKKWEQGPLGPPYHNFFIIHPRNFEGTVLKESDNLDILGVIFDSKLTFEKHLRSVSRAASQRLGILMKSSRVFHDKLLIWRCFWCFVLPV